MDIKDLKYGDRVLFKQSWRPNSIIHGYVLAISGEKILLQYEVSSDLFGDWIDAKWRKARHVIKKDPISEG
jgi:hypothetical protein